MRAVGTSTQKLRVSQCLTQPKLPLDDTFGPLFADSLETERAAKEMLKEMLLGMDVEYRNSRNFYVTYFRAFNFHCNFLLAVSRVRKYSM